MRQARPFDISEEMSRRRMEKAGVTLTATNTVMAELAQDWSRPEGEQLLGILFGEVLAQDWLTGMPTLMNIKQGE